MPGGQKAWDFDVYVDQSSSSKTMDNAATGASV
jgi:hypothetical protein